MTTPHEQETTAFIVWFRRGHPSEDVQVASVGGKGANLITMHRAGLNVPPGFCVTTDAYRAAVAPIAEDIIHEAAGTNSHAARELILKQEVPRAVRDAVVEAYRALGSPVVAVRSSATTEDLDSASFAGQQDTYLGVQGEESVVDAVRRCWASLWTDRAVAYRTEAGFSHESAELAVVVQEMVAADVAGVLFTADPISGMTDRMLVSASYGLGESVVAAHVNPDTFTLDSQGHAVETIIGDKETRIDLDHTGGTKRSPVPPDDRAASCLSDSDLRRLHALGRQVSAYYNAPQDIEWGICGDELYLLQTRPITSLSNLSNTDSGHGPAQSKILQMMRDDLIEHYPAPYPLDIMPVRKVQQEVQQVLGSFGVDTPPVDRVIRISDDGIASVHATWPRVSPRIVTHLPRTIRQAFSAANPDWDADSLDWKHELEAFQTDNRTLESITDRDLIARSHRAVDAAAELTRARFSRYLMPLMFKRAEADMMMKIARLGPSVTTEDLFANLDFVTAHIDREISRLCERARELGLDDVLVETDNAVESLSKHANGPAFLEEVQQTLSRIGARTPRMYLPYSSRSWGENPESFFTLIAAGIRGRHTMDADRADKRQLVRSRLPRFLHKRWDKTVTALRALHVAREGSLYLIEEWFVEARRVMDEIAHRLVERGILANPSDVTYALFDEVESALLAEEPSSDLQQRISRRKQKRTTAETLWWDRGNHRSETDGIKGVGASPGVTMGTARVIHGPEEFGLLEPGEVLVCRYTDPTWTPLFNVAAAVVADTGGPLSHAAIVAREVGIPAVLGTQSGTQDIVSGQTIRVDGNTGLVTPVESE